MFVKFGGMNASRMARLREFEEESCRLKKMYAEERLKAETFRRRWPKMVKTSRRREMALQAVCSGRVNIK
ncbi:hypothetical protein ACIOZM_30680 [Pseudomonas sp. NPDC087346]|uniref:hypothetical protein n=1 Tax=Pseudomonas sp. NPDC087346 TaxID=3364438 RepID=UPI00382B37F6